MHILVTLFRLINKAKAIPLLPSVSQGYNRLVHTTPFSPQSFFKDGLKLGHHGNIDHYVRAYGDTRIPLVMPSDNFCASVGFFMKEGKYSTGSAIVIDMPETIYRKFRNIRCTNKVVPKEFIRGAVRRDGTWIQNPNYDKSFIFSPAYSTLRSMPNLARDSHFRQFPKTPSLNSEVSPGDIW